MSKEEIDSNEVARSGDFPLVTSRVEGITQGGLSVSTIPLVFGLDGSVRNAIALHPEEFITYKMTYACKHCGKQWARLSVKEVEIPRNYAKDKEEKTDYDVHQEEEEVREEGYARED